MSTALPDRLKISSELQGLVNDVYGRDIPNNGNLGIGTISFQPQFNSVIKLWARVRQDAFDLINLLKIARRGAGKDKEPISISALPSLLHSTASRLRVLGEGDAANKIFSAIGWPTREVCRDLDCALSVSQVEYPSSQT
ncbi:hypothetical protein HOF56_03365 [Candidatus Peribacteria bacterium]|jgi:hypothetical protein|nr:hypothetical protein [Candidatus Peribacteria bacterium]MBT4021055.1 hypothetical protein [Candidatus Peribacteria bacterium]MBT4240776.1 hypothetical protein [Candidatus Peribacteria bacterium]MBT4474195.1 hypothetical protein [Candidatus Peribacteria bacterium]